MASRALLMMPGLIALAPLSAAAAPLSYLKGHGARAYPVVSLTWGLLIISVVVVAVVGTLVAGAVLRRPGITPAKSGERLALSRPEGGVKWIWIGVGLSSLVLLGSCVWTMVVLAQVTSPADKPALTIEVTGFQWWWKVRYLSKNPDEVFATANEIHIPTGVPVKVKLISGDVIHSFWVPALTGKTDLIPGQTNETWIEAKKPGIYRGQCTEYCGIEHARMGILVIAQKPSAFEAWRIHQMQSPAAPAGQALQAGRDAFIVHCGSCHSIRGTDAQGILGPDLSHLAERHTIVAGVLANTPENRARWISNPQSIKPGALMQKPELTQTQLTDINAYLATLN